MLPPVGSSRPSTSLAVVVLPQPDSPTRPPFTGKSLLRFFASMTGVAIGEVLAADDVGAPGRRGGDWARRREPAARRVTGRHDDVGRRLGAAAVHRDGAAWLERAARRQAGQVRRLAVDGGEPLPR